MYLQQEAEALHGDLRALQDMAASIHCMVTEEGDMVARTDSMSEMTSEHVQAAVVEIAERNRLLTPTLDPCRLRFVCRRRSGWHTRDRKIDEH